MLSFFAVAINVFVYLIPITSGACPYVANYYYSGYSLGCGATSCSTYSSGDPLYPRLRGINTCAADINTGVGEKFVCVDDAVKVELYSSTTCEGEPAESHQVLSVSENDPENYRAAYQYSCEDTGCTNWAQFLASQTSYDALGEAWWSGESFQCTNPDTDDWFDLYGVKFITNVCVDSTGDSTQPESSMKFGCDGSTFTLYRYTNDRTCSTTPEVETHSFPGCTELYAGTGLEAWATLVCKESGTNTDLLPTPPPVSPIPSPTSPPTARPTVSPSDVIAAPTRSPSKDPTQSSGAPSPAPSASTDNPTAAPSKAPSAETTAPSANPSVSPTGEEEVVNPGAAMTLRCIWSIFMTVTVTWRCL